MSKNKKIFIAGHKGMVGSAIERQLEKNSNFEVITTKKKRIDFTNQLNTNNFFQEHNFDYVYIAAAKVGGIYANNQYPANFIYDNLMIQSNIINACYQSSVKRLLFLGSSCIYPKFALQPIPEDELLNGKLESTNEPYAIAKIAGIKLCESFNRQFNTDYRSIMPTNLYGLGDNYHPSNSHVVPALISRFHEAKIKKIGKVEVWGTGKARREFLHVDDMASASVFLMNLEKEKLDTVVSPMNSHINVGYGSDISITELAYMIAEVVGFKGKIIFDDSKPDGTQRKLLDSSKIIRLGWRPKINLLDGLIKTYSDYINIL